MLGAPQVWTWLTTRWCPLPPPLSGLWWRALTKARWSAAAILARGIPVNALDQVVARCQTRFGESANVTPHDLEQFLDDLSAWDRLGMSRAEFDAQPWSWRMDQGHAQHPPPTGAHPRRPVYRSLTPAELAALDAEGLPWAERREKARAMQQSPPPEP